VIYARINLSKTDYQITQNWAYLNEPDINMLNNIYLQYCRHKKFKSVMPIFDSEYSDDCNDVIGYHYNSEFVAFSLIRKHSDNDIESLKNECAIYKSRGFKYLYLGEAAEYKKIDGYELLGPA
jgi:hypothetical protein